MKRALVGANKQKYRNKTFLHAKRRWMFHMQSWVEKCKRMLPIMVTKRTRARRTTNRFLFRLILAPPPLLPSSSSPSSLSYLTILAKKNKSCRHWWGFYVEWKLKVISSWYEKVSHMWRHKADHSFSFVSSVVQQMCLMRIIRRWVEYASVK